MRKTQETEDMSVDSAIYILQNAFSDIQYNLICYAYSLLSSFFH